VGVRAGGLHALGIWSCPSGSGAAAYLLEVRRAVNAHGRWLSGPGPRLVGGDLNVMGTGYGAAGFRRLAGELSDLGLRSAYHAFFEEHFGAESRATYFHHRRRDRPFHIDFCFLSADLLERVRHVEVGAYDDWVAGAAGSVSDHVPLVVELAPALTP
jgi:endonuclease/exonuclease/phosphatase family metal-dependent hydrolase